MRALALLLLCVLGYTLAGQFLVLLAVRHEVRKEVKEKIEAGIPDAQLVRFRPDDSRLQWQHEKEFSLHGQMYDVVRRTQDAQGTTVLLCIADTQETRVMAALDEAVNRHLLEDKKGCEKHRQLHHKVLWEYIIPQKPALPQPSFYTASVFVFSHIPLEVPGENPSPPPRIFPV